MNAKNCEQYKSCDCCRCKNGEYHKFKLKIQTKFLELIIKSELLLGSEFKQYVDEDFIPTMEEFFNG